MSPLISTIGAAAAKGFGLFGRAAPGQFERLSGGVYNFTVPTGIYEISAVCIGGGGGGNYNHSGAGGSLSYSNNISVFPGEILTLVVGEGGFKRATLSPLPGNDSYILRPSTSQILILAKGGGSTSTNSGDVSYVGGAGQSGVGAGGGGAAGYAGNGGAGGIVYNAGQSAATNSGGGGGGGGSADYINQSGYTFGYYGAGGGGGVGVLGIGSTGTGGAAGVYNTDPAGKGGIGGSTGGNGNNGAIVGGGLGGSYGGGGGSGGYAEYEVEGVTNTDFWNGGDGRNGAIRIIWGANRSYPNNAANV